MQYHSRGLPYGLPNLHLESAMYTVLAGQAAYFVLQLLICIRSRRVACLMSMDRIQIEKQSLRHNTLHGIQCKSEMTLAPCLKPSVTPAQHRRVS